MTQLVYLQTFKTTVFLPSTILKHSQSALRVTDDSHERCLAINTSDCDNFTVETDNDTGSSLHTHLTLKLTLFF